MKSTVKTSRAAGYLEKMFRILNDAYFSGVIEAPIITIQSTPRAYGHVTVSKAWSKGLEGERRHALNIGAGTLSRDIIEVTVTLLHEMVHLYNLQTGVKDVSRGGAYHNKQFRFAAEAVGLIPTYDPRIGWSHCEASEKLVDFVADQGWTEILINRNEGYTNRGPGVGSPSGGDTYPPKANGHSRKYSCPCCGMSVRATKDLTGKLQCTVCKQILMEI